MWMNEAMKSLSRWMNLLWNTVAFSVLYGWLSGNGKVFDGMNHNCAIHEIGVIFHLIQIVVSYNKINSSNARWILFNFLHTFRSKSISVCLR